MVKGVKKVIAFALALTMLMGMGTMAFAAENESEPVCAEENTVDSKDVVVDSKIIDDILSSGLVESVSFTENAVSIESLNGRFAINQVTDEPALASVAGDQYEPNNSFATATSGLMGRKIAATLYEGDVDWYEINITDTSLDYAFILMNIPNGCDYDMVVVNSDGAGYAKFQEGTTAESFYLTFNEIGTFYVGVQAYSGYSTSPYWLYYGPAIQNGSTGWRDPGLSYNFGNVPRGSSAKSVPAQNINLTNDSSIPDGAVLSKIRITDEGTNREWAGFYKYLRTSSGNTFSQIGNLEVMTIPEDQYYVKQNWSLWGTVQYSQYFTWQPRYFIEFKFVVAPQTLFYVN